MGCKAEAFLLLLILFVIFQFRAVLMMNLTHNPAFGWNYMVSPPIKVSWKVWEYLEVNEFQYYITASNEYQVPSHEEIECLNEFTKDL